MPAVTATTVAPQRPSGRSLGRHLADWLGFGVAQATVPDNQVKLEDVVAADIVIRLNWRTRLRLLVSGKGHIELLMWADASRQMRSVHAFAVLPPG